MGVVTQDTEVNMSLVVIEREGPSGNAFAVLGLASKALKQAGAAESVIQEFIRKATESDYEHLLRVAREYCRQHDIRFVVR